VDGRTLLVPDMGGNLLFQSYQNLESNPKVRLLFIIPGMNITARVNGRVEVIEPEVLAERSIEPELSWQDGNSGLIQGFLLHIDEAYLHCPRSMQFADLWNTATIETNAGRSLKSLLEG